MDPNSSASCGPAVNTDLDGDARLASMPCVAAYVVLTGTKTARMHLVWSHDAKVR